MSPFKPTQLVLALTHMLTFDPVVHQGSEAGWEPLHEKSSRFNKKSFSRRLLTADSAVPVLAVAPFLMQRRGKKKKKLFHSRDNKMVTIGVTLELQAVWSHT